MATNASPLAIGAAGAVLRRVASPPIYGIRAGLCIGLLPPLRWAFLSGPHDGHKPPLRLAKQVRGVAGLRLHSAEHYAPRRVLV